MNTDINKQIILKEWLAHILNNDGYFCMEDTFIQYMSAEITPKLKKLVNALEEVGIHIEEVNRYASTKKAITLTVTDISIPNIIKPLWDVYMAWNMANKNRYTQTEYLYIGKLYDKIHSYLGNIFPGLAFILPGQIFDHRIILGTVSCNINIYNNLIDKLNNINKQLGNKLTIHLNTTGPGTVSPKLYISLYKKDILYIYTCLSLLGI